MQFPRCRIPGQLKVALRFTADDEPWLSSLTRDEISYCIGYATSDPGVVVHGALVFGNCCALVVTDTTGLLHKATQRMHTCLTELSNRSRGRKRGTIWDNRKPSESFIIGWEAAKLVLDLLAVRAASAADSDDPYLCPGFFGPRDWGKYQEYERPSCFNVRSIRPTRVHLNPKVPDCAPQNYLDELIAEADDSARGRIAESRDTQHARASGTLPELGVGFGEFIGPNDVVPLLEAELQAWRAYYQRCRLEFQTDQLTAFPAGTCRFRELGAATDPCPTYVAPHQPRRRPAPPRAPPS